MDDDPLPLPILADDFKSNSAALYEAWRKQHGPVVAVRLPSGMLAWLVLSHELARALLVDGRLSKQRPTRHEGVRHPLFDNLLWMDPPQHTSLRAALGRAFSAGRIAALRARITALANVLLDAVEPLQDVDLMRAYALPLPYQVICELLGVPEDERAALLDELRQLEAAEMSGQDHVLAAAQSIDDRLARIAADAREGGANGLITELVAAAERGDFRADHVPSFAFLLLAAGHETTANLIGNAVLRLLQTGGGWQRLCASPDDAGPIIEEVLRLDSPLETATARYAREDFTVGAACIRAGETVFVGLAAANRDPDRFDRAHEMSLDRAGASTHLAFGHGAHACLGAPLARLEGHVALRELARRFPDLRLRPGHGSWGWKPGLISRGLSCLTVQAGPPAR